MLLHPFNVAIHHEEKRRIIQLQELLKWEESLLKQKSRCNWIQAGDQNSKFFFRMLQQRKARNSITQLILANGEVCTNQDIIRSEIMDYYKNFLGTGQNRNGIIDISEFQDMVVPSKAKDSLCSMVTETEIREALWNIKDDKSPGPDGYNSYFFKKTWTIVGKEICNASQDFFLKREDAKTSKFNNHYTHTKSG